MYVALRWLLLPCLCAGLWAGAASASGKAPPDPLQDPLILRSEFLRAHPDLEYRLKGMEALQRGRNEEAFRHFQRAARYADKASQAMVAEALWEGRGVAADRAQGYVWMDMAAELGQSRKTLDTALFGARKRVTKAAPKSPLPSVTDKAA